MANDRKLFHVSESHEPQQNFKFRYFRILTATINYSKYKKNKQTKKTKKKKGKTFFSEFIRREKEPNVSSSPSRCLIRGDFQIYNFWNKLHVNRKLIIWSMKSAAKVTSVIALAFALEIGDLFLPCNSLYKQQTLRSFCSLTFLLSFSLSLFPSPLFLPVFFLRFLAFYDKFYQN